MSARREVATGLACYAAYLAVRRAVWTREGRRRAERNAHAIAEVERRLGADVELRVQAAAARVPQLVHLVNAGYAAGNVALSVGWLILLHRRRDPAFARERRAAVVAFTASLPVFLTLPTAPPRMLDEYTDTLLTAGVDLNHPMLVRFYNPIASMPSHHVAFATVTGLGLAARSRSPIGRSAWRSYPLAVACVVVATANHFVLDVLAGAAVGLLARRCTR